MENVIAYRLLIGFAINLVCGIYAFMKESVDESGFFSGVIIFTLMYVFLDWQAYAVIITFFVLTSISIDIENRNKIKKGTFELYKAKRPMGRVLGRSLSGTIFAGLFFLTNRAEFKLAFVAGYAESICDTVSTKLGKVFNPKARLITNFKLVPHGTHGGISLQGVLFGILAALILGFIGFITNLIKFNELVIVVASAFFGSIVDSFLNAYSHQKRHLPNEFINFFSSMIAGLICIGFWFVTVILLGIKL